jgi:AMMECR1 domain-containing protein
MATDEAKLKADQAALEERGSVLVRELAKKTQRIHEIRGAIGYIKALLNGEDTENKEVSRGG